MSAETSHKNRRNISSFLTEWEEQFQGYLYCVTFKNHNYIIENCDFGTRKEIPRINGSRAVNALIVVKLRLLLQ